MRQSDLSGKHMKEEPVSQYDLQDSVLNAIKILANGFLEHPKNKWLQKMVKERKLDENIFYRELLILVYRQIFLLTAEERNTLTVGELKSRYVNYIRSFSMGRLYEKATALGGEDDHNHDLYLRMRALFYIIQRKELALKIGIMPPYGELFAPLSLLEDLHIFNHTLLRAFDTLCHDTDAVPIDFKNIDPDEVAGALEAFCQAKPYFIFRKSSFAFDLAREEGRGYIPPELIAEITESTLLHVVEGRLKEAAGVKADTRETLLSISICDPACGSGRFLLAAARFLGKKLAPAEADDTHAIRKVIKYCIHGVDKNILAVDLCKFVLWLAGHTTGMPLVFLKPRVRCGDALIGVHRLERLEAEFPSDDRSETEDTGGARKQLPLPFATPHWHKDDLLQQRVFEEYYEDSPAAIVKKEEEYKALHKEDSPLWRKKLAAHLWTSSFFSHFARFSAGGRTVKVTGSIAKAFIRSPDAVTENEINHIQRLSTDIQFFHWPLEFPSVFARGGFDIVLCCPPWQPVKNQEKSFLDRFLRDSGRFLWVKDQKTPNAYLLYTELITAIVNKKGRAGVIVPGDMVLHMDNVTFFNRLIKEGYLNNLYVFTNTHNLLPGMDNSFRFCLLELGGQRRHNNRIRFGFSLEQLNDLKGTKRFFELRPTDIFQINPNTSMCPVFRNSDDAYLVSRIYNRFHVLLDENKRENPLLIEVNSLFDSKEDDHLFITGDELEKEGCELVTSRYVQGEESWVPLYEGSMISQYDHRYGSFVEDKFIPLRKVEKESAQSKNLMALPRFWVSSQTVAERIGSDKYLLVFRSLVSPADERTVVAAVIPFAAGDESLLSIRSQSMINTALLLANMNTFVLDYIIRSQLETAGLTADILKQVPIIDSYTDEDISFIVPRLVELTFTAWELKPFIDDLWATPEKGAHKKIEEQWVDNYMAAKQRRLFWRPGSYKGIEGFPYPPFKWNLERRQTIKAELDAYYLHLYKLDRDDVMFILGFNEGKAALFITLKEREIETKGEYIIGKRILKIWEEIQRGGRIG